MKKLSEQMLAILERLAEMFPMQSYQSKLEDYLNRFYIDNPAQLEHLQRQFDQKQARAYL